MTADALVPILAGADFADWSVCVLDSAGAVVAALGADVALPTASVGKVLLLVEFARRLELTPSLAAVTVSKSTLDPVRQAGLWQHLDAETITLGDAAVLAAAVSDNLAANALLQHVGLDHVHAVASLLGLRRTAVLDRLREARTPRDAPEFSVGSADELAHLMLDLAHRRLLSAAVSERVAGWLALNADLSMVAAAFELDPLYRPPSSYDPALINKTGGDVGTRAEVGVVGQGETMTAYAAIASWTDADPDTAGARDTAVLRAMHGVGSLIAARLRVPSRASEG